MRRFLAFVWHPRSDRDAVAGVLRAKFAARRSSWETLAELPGLVVLSTGADSDATRVYELPGPHSQTELGVIIGNLFARSYVADYERGAPGPAAITFDVGESEAVATSHGRQLIADYWGRYVSFLFDPSTASRVVLRDPSGALPCYYTSHQEVGLYFSDVEDLAPLDLPRFTVNWRHLGDYLHFEYTQTSATGLREVHTLLPGQCRIVSTVRPQSQFLWSAVDVARRDVIDDAAEAAAALRQAVTACVAAWSSLYDHIIHRLSGGLDSSLVLAALSEASTPARVTGLHFTSDAVDSEERRYARLAAEYAGIGLLEQPIVDPVLDGRQLARIPTTALPMNYDHGLGVASLDARLSKELGANVFFSGHGGDEVLGASSGQFGAIDYLRRHRPSRSLVRIAMDAALLQRESLWSVLYEAVRVGTLRRSIDPFDVFTGTPCSALSDKLRARLRIENIAHPLLADAPVSPGKLLHLFAVATPYMNATLAAPADAVEQLHPLHSQPVVEACLGVPTYLLSIGGRNRGLARNAFVGLAEPTVLARNSKGSGDQHHEQIARKHDAFIRDSLRDGTLAEHGLLDVSKLDRLVDGDQAELAVYRPQLLTFLYAEDWASRWA